MRILVSFFSDEQDCGYKSLTEQRGGAGLPGCQGQVRLCSFFLSWCLLFNLYQGIIVKESLLSVAFPCLNKGNDATLILDDDIQKEFIKFITGVILKI